MLIKGSVRALQQYWVKATLTRVKATLTRVSRAVNKTGAIKLELD